MMSMNDPRSESIRDGYRVPYDPRRALNRLRIDANDTAAWAELWNELHHQGGSFVVALALLASHDVIAPVLIPGIMATVVLLCVLGTFVHCRSVLRRM